MMNSILVFVSIIAMSQSKYFFIETESNRTSEKATSEIGTDYNSGRYYIMGAFN